MTTALSIECLSKTYRNGFVALKNITFSVAKGDFFALLGPNGAGKTTLIGIITSLINKTSGSVTIFDKNIDKSLSAAKKNIGLVPQEFNFSVFEKVHQIVTNQAGYYGLPNKLANERTKKYLKRLDLWNKRDAQARMLSGGMKRRLMIVRALVHEPKLLILDEPTAGVDIEIRHSMWQFLREINTAGTTIILTTHYLEEAENLCNKIAIIDRGRIIENTSMHALLDRSHVETFVLYLTEALTDCPDLENFPCRLVNDKTLEVDVGESQDVNALFSLLNAKKIKVKSLRNKVNRLEKLFLRLVSEEKKE